MAELFAEFPNVFNVMSLKCFAELWLKGRQIIRLPNLAGTGGFPEVLGGMGVFIIQFLRYRVVASGGRRRKRPRRSYGAGLGRHGGGRAVDP